MRIREDAADLFAISIATLIAFWPAPGILQPLATARIAWVLTGTEASSRANVDAMRAGLRDLGHVEGVTYVLDLRYADGHVERYPQLFEDVIRGRPNVVVAGAYQGILAARNATRTTPIVGVSCGVELLVDSLARPTGNVTGVTCQSPELGPKQVQLFREAVPGAKRIAILFNPEVPYTEPEVRVLRRALAAMGVGISEFPVVNPAQFDSVVTAIRRQSADGVFVIPDNMVYGNRNQLAQLLLANHLAPNDLGKTMPAYSFVCDVRQLT